MRYTAIVPARSGSKRLGGKNVRLLNGLPLVVWTLKACVEAPEVDEVIFSTDSMEYWALAKSHITSDKLRLDYRSSKDAGDNVKIFDYIKINVDKIFGHHDGKFLLALPTAPLRTSAHITEAIKLSEETSMPVFSAVEYSFAVSFAFGLSEGGAWFPLSDESPMVTGNTRSQDQVKAYHPNGAIYLRDIKDLRMSSLSTLYQDAMPMIMRRSESIDIDSHEDLVMAELMMQAKQLPVEGATDE